MFIASTSLPSVTFPFSRNRVSSHLTTGYYYSSSLEISSIYNNLSIRSRVRRSRSTLYSSKVKVIAMAELSEKKNDLESVNNDDRTRSAEPVTTTSQAGHSLTFLDVRNEEELLSGIKKETEAGRLPSNVAAALEELYENYRSAILQSGHPMAHEIIVSNMAVAFDRMLLEVEDPFVFSPHHKAVREPFDYYMFGQNYIRPLIDFRRSYVGNISVFYDMEEKLRQGHNVVLISNHQSEADPAVISLLLEMTNPQIAENLTYVAGDRVVTDPLCKPFSMGRNLICVYSKKHMNDIPELAEMKRRSNTRSLKEMALLLRGGSQLIWIAPSGGRDRPDPSTGEWFPGQAPFDASAVDNIRRLADHSSVPGHIYPLALMCHDIMPPPAQVEKEIGERRVIAYHGVGLSVCPEISFNEVAAGHEDPEKVGFIYHVAHANKLVMKRRTTMVFPRRVCCLRGNTMAKEAYSQALFSSVTEQYNTLKAAINENQGLKASTSTITLSQPWQ